MKRTLLLFLFVAFAISCFADQPVAVNQLPKNIVQFVESNFPTEQIAFAKRDGFSEYELYLTDRTEIEFEHGKWKTVKNRAGINVAPIKAAIANYIGENYGGVEVVEIESKAYGYEVELGNRIELIFDKAGKFLHQKWD